jgi:sugar-phosphatase
MGRIVTTVEHSYDAICFDLFGTLVEEDGSAIDGAAAALEAMAQLRWAIVTSCGKAFALTLLAHAGLIEPPVLVSADDVTRTKPAPEPYALAARRLGVAADRALAIEDSRHGIASGRSAGMDVLAVLRGRPLSYAAEAFYVVENLRDIRFEARIDGTVRVHTVP